MNTLQNFSANVGEGWVSVDAKLPQRGRYVLVARNSGYSSTPIEYLTAQLNTNYKGWTDPSNTRLTDSGPNPIYWFDGDLPLLPTPPVKVDNVQKPIAYMHTLHQELGQFLNCLSESDKNPFGVQGIDYSNSYSVTSIPLYAEKSAK